jgi:hypothetical protein
MDAAGFGSCELLLLRTLRPWRPGFLLEVSMSDSYEKWLADLKPGDAVVVRQGWDDGPYLDDSVRRRTPTGIIVLTGKLSFRPNGTARGRGNYGRILDPTDPMTSRAVADWKERKAAERHARAVNELQRALKGAGHHLSADQTELVLRFIKENFKEWRRR